MPVHHRHLQLVLKVRRRPGTSHDDLRAFARHKPAEQIIKPFDRHVGEVRALKPREFHPLLKRKKRFFLGTGGHSHRHKIK